MANNIMSKRLRQISWLICWPSSLLNCLQIINKIFNCYSLQEYFVLDFQSLPPDCSLHISHRHLPPASEMYPLLITTCTTTRSGSVPSPWLTVLKLPSVKKKIQFKTLFKLTCKLAAKIFKFLFSILNVNITSLIIM